MPQVTDKTDNKKIVSQWTTQKTVDVDHDEVGGIYLYQLLEIMPQVINAGNFASVCQYKKERAKNPIDYALDLGDPQKSRSYHLRISSSIDSKKEISYPYGHGEQRLSDVQAKKKLLNLIVEDIAKRVASEKEDEDLQHHITNLLENIVLPQLAQFRIDVKKQLNEFAGEKISITTDMLRVNYDPSTKKLSVEFVAHSDKATGYDVDATMVLTADLAELPKCRLTVERSVQYPTVQQTSTNLASSVIVPVAEKTTIDAKTLLDKSNINIALDWYRQYATSSKSDAFAVPGGNKEEQLYLDWKRGVNVQGIPRLQHSIFEKRYFEQRLAKLVPDVARRQRFQRAYSQDLGNLISQLMSGFYSTNRLHIFSWVDSITASVLTIQEQGKSLTYTAVVQPVMVMFPNGEKLFLPEIEFRWNYIDDGQQGQFVLDAVSSTNPNMVKLVTQNLILLDESLLSDERNSKNSKQIVKDFNQLLSLQLDLLGCFLTSPNDDNNDKQLLTTVINTPSHKPYGIYRNMPNTQSELTKQQKKERVISKKEAIKNERAYLKGQIKTYSASTKVNQQIMSNDVTRSYSTLMYGVLSIAHTRGMGLEHQVKLAKILKVIFQRFPNNAENYLNKLSALVVSNDCPTTGENLDKFLQSLYTVMTDANAKSIDTLFDLVKITMTSNAILSQRARKGSTRSEALLQALIHALNILQKIGSNQEQQGELKALFKTCLDEIVTDIVPGRYQPVLAKLSQLAESANIRITRSDNQTDALEWLQTSVFVSVTPSSTVDNTAANTPIGSLSRGDKSPEQGSSTAQIIHTSLVTVTRPINRTRASSAPIPGRVTNKNTPDSSPNLQTPSVQLADLETDSSTAADITDMTTLAALPIDASGALLDRTNSVVAIKGSESEVAASESTLNHSDTNNLLDEIVTVTIPESLPKLDKRRIGLGGFARNVLASSQPIPVEYSVIDVDAQGEQVVSNGFFSTEVYQREITQKTNAQSTNEFNRIASEILIDALVTNIYSGKQQPPRLAEILKASLHDNLFTMAGAGVDKIVEIVADKQEDNDLRNTEVVKYSKPASYVFSVVGNTLTFTMPGNIELFDINNAQSKIIGHYETVVVFTRVADGYEINIYHKLSLPQSFIKKYELQNWLVDAKADEKAVNATTKYIDTDSDKLQQVVNQDKVSIQALIGALNDKGNKAQAENALCVNISDNDGKLYNDCDKHYTVSYKGRDHVNLSLAQTAAIAEIKLNALKPSIWQRALAFFTRKFEWFSQSTWIKAVKQYEKCEEQLQKLNENFLALIGEKLKAFGEPRNLAKFDVLKEELLALVEERKAMYQAFGQTACDGFETCSALLRQSDTIHKPEAPAATNSGELNKSSSTHVITKFGIKPKLPTTELSSVVARNDVPQSNEVFVQLDNIPGHGFAIMDLGSNHLSTPRQ